MDMVRRRTTIGLMEIGIFLLLILGGVFAGMRIQQYYLDKPCNFSQQMCELRTNLRKLWADHAIWDREFIIVTIDDAPNKKQVTDRLKKNLREISDSMATFYGKEVGDQLNKLLEEHIVIGGQVVEAAKAGDKEKQKEADNRWHANAKEIADYLSSLNPNLLHPLLVKMLYEHLSLANKITDTRLKKEWKSHINTSDKAVAQAEQMADCFTSGIVKQFPDKF